MTFCTFASQLLDFKVPQGGSNLRLANFSHNLISAVRLRALPVVSYHFQAQLLTLYKGKLPEGQAALQIVSAILLLVTVSDVSRSRAHARSPV